VPVAVLVVLVGAAALGFWSRVLLLVTLAATVGGLAAFGHPGARGRVQLAVLIGTTVIFGLALVLAYDLDRPYDGPTRIEPTAMHEAARRIAALPGSDGAAPCDATGAPLPGTP
jgi:hypothetical protein